MSIVRYAPWFALRPLHGGMDKTEQRGLAGSNENSSASKNRWMPAVDIHEDDQNFVITADVPGVAPQNIDITMEDGALTIKGNRAVVSTEESTYASKRIERVQGSFYRRFRLPDSADVERISAHGSNGVLEVTIPKKEASQPKRIEVAA